MTFLPVDGRLLEVVTDERVRLGRGVREVASELVARHLHLRVEAEPAHVLVTWGGKVGVVGLHGWLVVGAMTRHTHMHS